MGGGEKVKIKYDPNDISVIYVWDDFNSRFLPVPALDQEYTRNLTIWQHHIIRKYARRCVRTHVDIAALCHAKELIQQIVEGERLLGRGISGMQGIAHYLNIGQPNYETTIRAPAQLPKAEETRQFLPANPAPHGEVLMHPQSHSETASGIQYEEEREGSGHDGGQDSAEAEEGWGADYDLPVGE
jgi:hypothetical protein